MPAEFRKCPLCQELGVEIRALYPNGTQCQYCNKLIEINTTVLVAVVGGLVGVLILDLGLFGSGLGYVAAACLVTIALFMQELYPRLLPLTHYRYR